MTLDTFFLVGGLMGFAILLILAWGLQQIIEHTKRTANACEAMAEALKKRSET